MSDTRITDLTELTTPVTGDLIPIVDVSDTTDGASGTTKKIQYANLTGGFPTSSTDNAIARFDGTTGKLLQNSALIVSDLGVNVDLRTPTKAGVGTGVGFYGGSSSDDDGGTAFALGGTPLAGNKAGGAWYGIGGAGIGSGTGGQSTNIGGQGGATGAGGPAIVQGGAGGATSGDGGPTNIYGGDATNGNGNGGDNVFAPGAKNGSGNNGLNKFYAYKGASYGAWFDLNSIASSNKIFTFPNRTMTLVGSLKGTSASLAQNATETILTPTFGTYIVTIDASGIDNTAWRGSWMVFAGGALVVTAITAPSNVDLVISGGNIQVKNTNASATALRWSYTCIGNNI